MSFSRLLTLTTIQSSPFLAFSPSRALLAAMARRAGTGDEQRQGPRHRTIAGCFLPLSRAGGSDGATRRHHPSQGHGSSPSALHQKPRCMTDSRDSIVPGQFSSLPDFDAELPAVPAPQCVMLHPHQLHILTRRELLACTWWSCASARTGKPQESNRKPHYSS